MKVRFLYPFALHHEGVVCFSAEVMDVKEVKYLNNIEAVFDNGFGIPLAVFFKITEPVKEKSAGKRITYPKNFDDQFERLWAAKGKKGSKAKAKSKYKGMFTNESDETCEDLTNILVDDIESNIEELGAAEMHLTTYLNQKRWERD
jgi:hypothetical protein